MAGTEPTAPYVYERRSVARLHVWPVASAVPEIIQLETGDALCAAVILKSAARADANPVKGAKEGSRIAAKTTCVMGGDELHDLRSQLRTLYSAAANTGVT